MNVWEKKQNKFYRPGNIDDTGGDQLDIKILSSIAKRAYILPKYFLFQIICLLKLTWVAFSYVGYYPPRPALL